MWSSIRGRHHQKRNGRREPSAGQSSQPRPNRKGQERSFYREKAPTGSTPLLSRMARARTSSPGSDRKALEPRRTLRREKRDVNLSKRASMDIPEEGQKSVAHCGDKASAKTIGEVSSSLMRPKSKGIHVTPTRKEPNDETKVAKRDSNQTSNRTTASRGKQNNREPSCKMPTTDEKPPVTGSRSNIVSPTDGSRSDSTTTTTTTTSRAHSGAIADLTVLGDDTESVETKSRLKRMSRKLVPKKRRDSSESEDRLRESRCCTENDPNRRKNEPSSASKLGVASLSPPVVRLPGDTSSAATGKFIVFRSHGFKVTMVDFARKIFVVDLLSSETCELIKHITNDHFHQMCQIGEKSRGWRTLYTYTRMDLPCCDIEGLSVIVQRILHDVRALVGDVYHDQVAASELRPRSWKEPHLLLYQKVSGREDHTGIPMHYDGCQITFQIMLSAVEEYTGGGTYFRCLQRTVKLHQGQMLCHPGSLYHLGVDIDHGFRFLMVGFLDGFDPKISDRSNGDDDRVEYQENVIEV